MFGRTDLVIHLLDRNNISTEGIDEALTFSVHASTENIDLHSLVWFFFRFRIFTSDPAGLSQTGA